MNKECPFKKNTSRRNSCGYLVSDDRQCAMIQITFGVCTGTKCMAYNDIANTCRLLEKGTCLNECGSSQSI